MTKADDRNIQDHSWGAVLLLVLSVAGGGIGYAVSIVAARLLGPAAFENYAVSIATLGLLASVAEAGVGKYALKVMPAFAAAEQWPLASGYWRFGLRVSLLISIALATTVILWEGIEDGQFWDYPVAVAALFLPAAALSGVGVDFVMANRAAVAGSVIARLVIPGTTFLLLSAAGYWLADVSAGMAVACFGTGSLVGAVLCSVVFRQTSSREQLFSKPGYQRKEWLKECASFVITGFLMTWILRISIVILELLPIPETEVGLFAAAMETGCLILLLSKSTDKLFQPDMSVIIQQRNVELGVMVRDRRYLLVGTGCVAFLTVIFFGGRQILGLYGPEFRAAYPALCCVSLGACFWTIFSLAPIYLRFVGLNNFVIAVTVGGAVLIAILTMVLGFRYGATGAGMAFCIVHSLMAVTFFIHARRNFLRLDAEVEDPTA